MAGNSSISNSEAIMRYWVRTRSLLKKVILIILFARVFDFGVGRFLRTQYFKAPVGKLYRTTYSLEKTHEELLVFGSSRAYSHYFPDILEKELKMSYYNVGHDAASIMYSRALLKGILRRYKPRAIILDIRYDDLEIKKMNYDMLSALLPYYQTHPEIRDILLLRSRFEAIKLLSQIYPFNSHLLSILTAKLKNNAIRWVDKKGYSNNNNKWKFGLKLEDLSNRNNIDPVAVQNLIEFIQDIKKSDIKLLVVMSPYYRVFKGQSKSMMLIKTICDEYGIYFLNYSQLEKYLFNPELIFDPNHLNQFGAIQFTEDLCKNITEIGRQDPEFNWIN